MNKEEAKKIIHWYQQNKRDLPWRHNQNPYHVWLSEIMLQQTRIETVIPYYKRFLKEIPTIEALAEVEEGNLLKLWEGLGYYNRIKNMQKAAQQIVEQYQGRFPEQFSIIQSLPGIGQYTASAIASICFNQKEVTIDGNVLRVYQRFNNNDDNIDEASTKKTIRAALMKIIPAEAGAFNQGLMEIGETICLPKGIPKCDICPLKENCQAHQQKTFLSLPVRAIKKEKRVIHYTVLMLTAKNLVALHQREENILLGKLWEFPLIEGKYKEAEIKQYLKDCNISVKSITKSIHYTHIFTHLKWQMQGYLIEINELPTNYVWSDRKSLIENYAIPGAFQPFLKELLKKVKE